LGYRVSANEIAAGTGATVTALQAFVAVGELAAFATGAAQDWIVDLAEAGIARTVGAAAVGAEVGVALAAAVVAVAFKEALLAQRPIAPAGGEAAARQALAGAIAAAIAGVALPVPAAAITAGTARPLTARLPIMATGAVGPAAAVIAGVRAAVAPGARFVLPLVLVVVLVVLVVLPPIALFAIALLVTPPHAVGRPLGRRLVFAQRGQRPAQRPRGQQGYQPTAGFATGQGADEGIETGGVHDSSCDASAHPTRGRGRG
jgi:hypothetical protein